MSALMKRTTADFVSNLCRQIRQQKKCNFRCLSTFRSSIKSLLSTPEDKEGLSGISIEGWIQKNARKHKNVTFWNVNDGSSAISLQIISDEHTNINGQITQGSSVSVYGDLTKSQGRSQVWEFLAKDITVIGECHDSYPLHMEKQDMNALRDHLHLRSRSQVLTSTLRVRSAASMAVHKYFQDNGYMFIHTPVITTNDCEGAGETFKVDSFRDSVAISKEDQEIDVDPESKHYFRNPAHLTVSGQLHLEAMIGSLKRVYNFGPAFRADNNIGRHHLSEFYMVEAELAFIDKLDTLLQVIEKLIKFTTKEVMSTMDKDLALVHKIVAPKTYLDTLKNIMDKDFIRIPYSDAINELEKKNKKFEVKVKWGKDLYKEHEKFLVKHCGNLPLFITDFPSDLKPFYALSNEDGKTVSALDLLLPDIGEVVGGTLREHRYDILHRKLEQQGSMEQLKWYLDLRKFGTTPHGGFGLGFERYLQFLLGTPNIKDTIPFPRSKKNCKL